MISLLPIEALLDRCPGATERTLRRLLRQSPFAVKIGRAILLPEEDWGRFVSWLQSASVESIGTGAARSPSRVRMAGSPGSATRKARELSRSKEREKSPQTSADIITISPTEIFKNQAQRSLRRLSSTSTQGDEATASSPNS